ncbi:MAG TPA: SCP2 sterol-binding domain-containing protein [Xanthobacteraceae bacterium]
MALTHPDQASRSLFSEVPYWLLAHVPIFLMQPVLDRIATHVARSRPELFARLGPHTRKRYLIDPMDLPFVLVLIPDAARPHLRAYRRAEYPRHDARIAGTFLTLLEMIAGSLDGDALFFTRDLQVSGDTEAVVALRNALDDFDGSVVDAVVAAFGPLSGPAALALSAMRGVGAEARHAR